MPSRWPAGGPQPAACSSIDHGHHAPEDRGPPCPPGPDQLPGRHSLQSDRHRGRQRLQPARSVPGLGPGRGSASSGERGGGSASRCWAPRPPRLGSRSASAAPGPALPTPGPSVPTGPPSRTCSPRPRPGQEPPETPPQAAGPPMAVSVPSRAWWPAVIAPVPLLGRRTPRPCPGHPGHAAGRRAE